MIRDSGKSTPPISRRYCPAIPWTEGVTEEDVGNVTLRLVRLFLDGGFPLLQQQVDPAMDEETARTVNSASMKILRFGLEQALYGNAGRYGH